MTKSQLVEELENALQTLERVEELLDVDIDQIRWEIDIAIRRIKRKLDAGN